MVPTLSINLLKSVSDFRSYDIGCIVNVNDVIHLAKPAEGERSDNMRNLDWILKLRMEEQAIIEERLKRV